MLPVGEPKARKVDVRVIAAMRNVALYTFGILEPSTPPGQMADFPERAALIYAKAKNAPGYVAQRNGEGRHDASARRAGGARRVHFGDRYDLARHLRAALRQTGVSRSQLFEQTDTRLALRAHDLRASFVTVNLALGKSEAWITDRTGHRSSQMIYRYKRQARTHAELNLGGFKPLHEAIPELAESEA